MDQRLKTISLFYIFKILSYNLSESSQDFDPSQVSVENSTIESI